MYAQNSEKEVEGRVRDLAPLVKRIAHHLISRLPPSVQVDDLVQAGMIGLLEASRNYDATQGASFETYAGIRIRGAMLDEIRKGDWVPRSLHRRTRALAKAVHNLEAEHGRDARDTEVAERMGISLEEYFQILQDTSAHKVFSFEDVPARVEAVSEGFTQKIPASHEYAADRDFQEALGKAIASLPERERLVIALYSVLRPIEWEGLDSTNLGVLRDRVIEVVGQLWGDSRALHDRLCEILAAQDYQDLIGQVIQRVVQLLQEVEAKLATMASLSGGIAKEARPHGDEAEPERSGEEPQARPRVLTSQGEVDELLAALGR